MLRWAVGGGDAQRPVLHANNPKKTSAQCKGAVRGQNLYIVYRVVYSCSLEIWIPKSYTGPFIKIFVFCSLEKFGIGIDNDRQ